MFKRPLVLLALVLLQSCGGGGGGGSSTNTPVSSCPASSDSSGNVISVCVDSGPLTTQREVNRLYTDITICEPGTRNCQTIDHVLVDTASVGLRLLDSVVTLRTSSTSYFNCVRFLDLTYAWGSVSSVDLNLGRQTVRDLPIQLLGSSAAACASGGYSAIQSVADLGAKGILGIGFNEQDCGSACTSSSNNSYYTCADAVCNTGVPLNEQLQNPIAMLGANSNGFAIDLPAVPAPGTSTLRGELILGIGTHNMFSVSTKTKLVPVVGSVTDSSLYFSTQANGFSYVKSFIDTGSNGIFFDSTDAAMTVCGDWYCPTPDITTRATLSDSSGASTFIDFSAGNASNLFSDQNRAAIPTLAGPFDPTKRTRSDYFDWGLPFYFGRKVFQGISGKDTTDSSDITITHTGPFIGF